MHEGLAGLIQLNTATDTRGIQVSRVNSDFVIFPGGLLETGCVPVSNAAQHLTWHRLKGLSLNPHPGNPEELEQPVAGITQLKTGVSEMWTRDHTRLRQKKSILEEKRHALLSCEAAHFDSYIFRCCFSCKANIAR